MNTRKFSLEKKWAAYKQKTIITSKQPTSFPFIWLSESTEVLSKEGFWMTKNYFFISCKFPKSVHSWSFVVYGTTYMWMLVSETCKTSVCIWWIKYSIEILIQKQCRGDFCFVCDNKSVKTAVLNITWIFPNEILIRFCVVAWYNNDGSIDLL